VKLDAPFYTEAELDALYETDPVAALRISPGIRKVESGY
jgi:hypothetical protein